MISGFRLRIAAISGAVTACQKMCSAGIISFSRRASCLSYEEIEILARVFIRFGVRKVRLTGGEPLLRRDLEELVIRLAGIKRLDDLAITTNASLLTESRVRSLKNAGVDRINISLDALDNDIYEQINQVPSPLEHVLAGIDYALAAGFRSVKINMVVQKDVNVSDILPMVRRFRGSGAILRFIEFMDVGNHNQWSMDQVFSAREIVDMIHKSYPLEPLDANYRGEVAQRWRYADGKGEIGVISSITQPFCGGCARLRLSAVGELFTCLFATSGYDLRKSLRSGASEQDVAAEIAGIWQNRSDRYSEERFSARHAGTCWKIFSKSRNVLYRRVKHPSRKFPCCFEFFVEVEFRPWSTQSVRQWSG